MRRVSFRPLGHADVPGGGQVTVQDGRCFIGHVDPPLGTSILDVRDPLRPAVISQIAVPAMTHSHKVRVGNGLILVNNEAYPTDAPGDARGLRIFDIDRDDRPREICFYPTGGRGVHRFDFDGRFAYLSTEMKGYSGNIVVILDVANPARPREVARWWLPGQWTAGGEHPPMPRRHGVHHPLRFGNHLFVGCCHAGLAVVDVADLSAPMTVARHPLHGLFTHTVLPLEEGGSGPKSIVAVDEGWWDLDGRVTLVDLSERSRPTILSQHEIPPGSKRAVWAPHQPHERVIDGLMFVAWFAHGLRVLDLSTPSHPREAGVFVPEARSEVGAMSNDVFVDVGQGRAYLVDRVRGLDILEMDM